MRTLTPRPDQHWKVLNHMVTQGGVHTFHDLTHAPQLGLSGPMVWTSIAWLSKHQLVSKNFNSSGATEYFATPSAAEFVNAEQLKQYYLSARRTPHRKTHVVKKKTRRVYTHRTGNIAHAPAVVTGGTTSMAPRSNGNGAGKAVKMLVEIDGRAVSFQHAREIYDELKGVFG